MRLIVGRIGRPHGIRGEVIVGVRTDEPDLRFAVGAVLDVERTLSGPGRTGEGSRVAVGDGQLAVGDGQLTVVAARWHSGQLLVAFAGITDRTAAGELTGSWLSVDSSQLPESTDPDEFRDHELIGLSVRTSGGDAVGVVADVLHHGQDLLVVRQDGDQDGGKGRDYLVPFVKAIVPEIDISAGILVIDPPPGLLDPAQAE
jgi:16S rRNA processing protein RimM